MSTTTTDELVVDLGEIMRILPHRGDMLLVDSARVNLAEATGEGSWYVRPDYSLLAGHYPGRPIFPGHLIAEMAAQAAGVVFAKTLGAGVEGVPFLRKSSFTFRDVVLPRDLLRVEVSSLSVKTVRNVTIVRATCVCFKNGDFTVADGDVTFAVTPPEETREELSSPPDDS